MAIQILLSSSYFFTKLGTMHSGIAFTAENMCVLMIVVNSL